MRIVVVCGMGIGTSILLKMTAEKALRAMDVDADVEAADIGTARGAARTANIVLTSADLVEEIGEIQAKIIVINNFTDVNEVTEKLKENIDT